MRNPEKYNMKSSNKTSAGFWPALVRLEICLNSGHLAKKVAGIGGEQRSVFFTFFR